MKKLAASLFSAMLILTTASCGYDGGYRYQCQDPANWNEQFCKKPHCSANGTCPEDLTHYEKNKVNQSAVPQQQVQLPQVPSKGDCK